MSNHKSKQIITNVSAAVLSNLLAFVVSIIVVLVVPRIIGVKEYGYWQLYIFYLTYVGFLHFGWVDGIYLRYGGEEYGKLDKSTFSSQFYSLLFFQITLSTLFIIISLSYINQEERLFILIVTAVSMVLVNVRQFIIYTLQATNRIRDFATIMILDRLLYILVIIIAFGVGLGNYKVLMIADIFSKAVSLIYACYLCKEIVLRSVARFHFSFRETLDNINAGIKLMFANIASLLIIGSLRFGIERQWDVVTFGKVSLALSVSNFMMLFINAIGVVVFPMLKRTDPRKLPEIYKIIREVTLVVFLGLLLFYYPIKAFLRYWLPQYHDSIVYLSFLFPLFLLEGKMALLMNTYLKALRKERSLFFINMISFILSVMLTIITTVVLKNLTYALLSIVVILFIRSSITELVLTKWLGVKTGKGIISEFFLIGLFIYSASYMEAWKITMVYGIGFAIYLLLNIKGISRTVQSMKYFVRA